MSAVRRGLEALPSGFHGAVEALEQRILDGPMHLYFEGKLPSRTSLEEYPAALERRLQDRIFAGDGEQARLLSEEFFDSLKNSPPEQALLYFHRLYFSTLSKGISILDVYKRQVQYRSHGKLQDGIGHCHDRAHRAPVSFPAALLYRRPDYWGGKGLSRAGLPAAGTP